MKNRREFEVVHLILNKCNTAKHVSHLSTLANLSYTQLMPMLDKLVKLGYLIKTPLRHRNGFNYQLSHEGHLFLKAIEGYATERSNP